MLSSSNFVQLSWPAVENARGYAVYGRANGSMKLLAVTAYTTWVDTGKPALVDLPTTLSEVPPPLPTRNLLVAQIESGGGTKNLTLDRPVEVSMDNVTVYHDDTIPLQVAFDFAASRSKQVAIPDGLMRISQPLQQGAITVIGNGDTSEIKTLLPFINVIESKMTNNPKLYDLKISGSGYGLQPVNTLEDPILDGSGCGIIYAGVNKGVIENVLIENCGGDGFTSHKNGVSGVWLTYGCSNVKIYSSYAKNCRNGFNEDDYYGRSSYFNTMKDCEATDCRFGFVTDCTTGKGFKLTDCRSVRCLYSGVDISRTNGARLVGHYFEECGNTGLPGVFSAALAVYGNANDRVTDFVAESCTFVDNYSYAAQLSRHTYDCKFKDFNIRGCKNDGAILVKSSRYYHLEDITIAECVGHGVRGYPEVLGSGAVAETVGIDYGTFKNITIHNCTKHGIYLDTAEHCIFESIILNRTGTENKSLYGGLVFDKSSRENIISMNLMTDVGRFGAGSLDEGTRYNIISGNFSYHNNGGISSFGFVSPNQFWMPNGNDRALSDARVTGAIDFRTSKGHLYIDEVFSGQPDGTTAGEIKIHTTNKQLLVNVDGSWYKTNLIPI